MPEHGQIGFFNEVTFYCITMVTMNILNHANSQRLTKGADHSSNHQSITLCARPGMGIAVPIAVRTGVGALGGGGASANS